MTDARDRRVSVVTGGASGIGAAIVEVLAARGDRVVLLDVGASSPPPGVTAMTADVGDEAMVEAAFQHVRAELGRVDVLVNCAGIGTPVRSSTRRWRPGHARCGSTRRVSSCARAPPLA